MYPRIITKKEDLHAMMSAAKSLNGKRRNSMYIEGVNGLISAQNEFHNEFDDKDHSKNEECCAKPGNDAVSILQSALIRRLCTQCVGISTANGRAVCRHIPF